MSRILLLSTYELGARPLGCTVPAAALAADGHEVRALDLSLGTLEPRALEESDGVVVSVPMHTAWRLTMGVLAQIRGSRPDVPVFVHGLYAVATADAAGVLLGPRDVVAAGEVGPALRQWAAGLGEDPGASPAGGPSRLVSLGKARRGPRPPQRRAGLAGLDAYARLVRGAEERLVGTLETSTGCNHTCRHCPVPVVYAGRSRAVALETTLAEADALIAEGARHLHLADPDFLNRPTHARAFARALHGAHPEVSFDATVKVSHLLRHADLLGELARCGLVLVTTALESTSGTVLARLHKGHTAAEMRVALELLRARRIEPRPSFLPFTPWTTRRDVTDLFDFVAEEDLVHNLDAVQYAIRLLLPPGSLLLADPDPVLAASLAGEDRANGGTAWRAADPALDACQEALAACAEQLADADARVAYDALRAVAHERLGLADQGAPRPRASGAPPGPERPRLSEAWFCCAEPTRAQLAGVGRGRGCEAGGAGVG